MRRRWIILAVLVLLLIVGALYGWNIYHRTNKSLADEKAAFTVKSGVLIRDFENADSIANQKYLGKVVSVQGKVKQVDKDPEGNYTVVLGDPTSTTSVRCALDSTYKAAAGNIKEASDISIKGMLTGYQKDETGLLGSDIKLNRCVIE